MRSIDDRKFWPESVSFSPGIFPAPAARMTARPFDIRERAFQFGCEIVTAFPERRPLDPASWRLWSQLVAAGTSVGAHIQEADAASSRAHFIALNRGALREAREAHYWLRLIGATKRCNHDRTPPLEQEALELVRILTAIVKRASRPRCTDE